jgi:glucose-6-phosphate dehydrogenase-like protein
MTPAWSGAGSSVSHGPGPANHGGATQTLLILWASGDLTSRLLLPGLDGLLSRGRIGGLTLIGSSRDDWDDQRWRQLVADAFAAGNASGRGPRRWWRVRGTFEPTSPSRATCVGCWTLATDGWLVLWL